MKEKLLYLNFIMSYKCTMNCDYCSLTKQQRQETDFLDFGKFKLYFLQLISFYKKNNYNKLVISITGDELHTIPNFLEYYSQILDFIKLHVKDIDKNNIKLKSHTNLLGTKEFYSEQIKLLESAKDFCVPEFETVYQVMYHTPKMENMLNYIFDITKNIIFVSNIALRNSLDFETVKHLKYDTIYNFSEMPKREKPSDKEINFLMIVKSKGIFNGCGYHIDDNLFKLEDKDFCSECPNTSCIMLENINRI